MRKSKAETARTRQRIVVAAGSEFLCNGITEAALTRVMSAAGLTHGGFYRHFESKDQLVAEACRQTLLSLTQSLESSVLDKGPRDALRTLCDKYVSADHRDHPATGCPLAALGSELARADSPTREAATEGFLRLSRLIAAQLRHLSPRKAEQEAMAIAATMIGAITLSRIVTSPRISDSILAAAHDYVLQKLRTHR